MRNSKWRRSRRIYLQYRDAKRKLASVSDKHIADFYHLEMAFKHYMDTQKEVTAHLDKDRLKDVTEAYQRFRKAKIEHDQSRRALKKANNDFTDIEIRYNKHVCRGLRRIGVRMVDAAEVFGYTTSTMSRWMNADADELEIHYENEFGGG